MRMAGEEGLVAVGWKVIAEMGIAQISLLAPIPCRFCLGLQN
jgi:hypothetical protein